MPADDADLENDYTAQEILDVADDDAVRVNQSADSEYAIHQYKNYVISPTIQLHWNGQTDIPPTTSTVVLQVYNQNTTTWETLDSDNTTGADTDFDLFGDIADTTNYRNGSNVMSCRIYQLAQ